MLKLNVTLILEAHCPTCGRRELPLGENTRLGVVAVCPGCGWEHQVRFLQEGVTVETPEVLSRVSSQLHEALGRMELPQDVILTPARERRENIEAKENQNLLTGSEDAPPAPPFNLAIDPDLPHDE